MSNKLPKEVYVSIVRTTLEGMRDLEKEMPDNYSFDADLRHYYKNVIEIDNVLTYEEFGVLVKEVS